MITGHVDGAETAQMGRRELSVEKEEAASAQADDQVQERHLAGIGYASEHGFAEEGSAKADPIEAADKPAIPLLRAPDPDRLGEAHAMQFSIEPRDGGIDPGYGALLDRLGAGAHHLAEGLVTGDQEVIALELAVEFARQMDAVEGQQHPQLWIDPVQLFRLGAFRHRKDAQSVGTQKQIR